MSKYQDAPLSVVAQRGMDERLVGRYLVSVSVGLVTLYAVTLGFSALRGFLFVDDAGRGMATDFIAFWGAARLALDGAAPLAYDLELLKVVQEFGLGQAYPGYFPWLYPPFFLFAVVPLALLPYVPSLLIWFALTLAAYLAAIRAILPNRATVVVVLATPAVCWNAITGQNGLLTAAILGSGLTLLERAPWLAGALFGLLAYKPQFFVMIPVILAVTGNWRALLGASATITTLIGSSILLFGWETWIGFLAAQQVAFDRFLVGGGIGMFKIQSIYAVLRFLGLTNGPALAAQGMLGIVITLGVVWLWRQRLSAPLKAAALSTGALAITPYVLIYDLAVLAVPVAFLAREGLTTGFRLGEVSALVGICLLPALFVVTPAPLGLLTYAVLTILIWRRAVAEPVSARANAMPSRDSLFRG